MSGGAGGDSEQPQEEPAQAVANDVGGLACNLVDRRSPHNRLVRLRGSAGGMMCQEENWRFCQMTVTGKSMNSGVAVRRRFLMSKGGGL